MDWELFQDVSDLPDGLAHGAIIITDVEGPDKWGRNVGMFKDCQEAWKQGKE